MDKLTFYEIENDFVYDCNDYERKKHITRLSFMKSYEDQKEYLEAFDDVIKRRLETEE